MSAKRTAKATAAPSRRTAAKVAAKPPKKAVAAAARSGSKTSSKPAPAGTAGGTAAKSRSKSPSKSKTAATQTAATKTAATKTAATKAAAAKTAAPAKAAAPKKPAKAAVAASGTKSTNGDKTPIMAKERSPKPAAAKAPAAKAAPAKAAAAASAPAPSKAAVAKPAPAKSAPLSDAVEEGDVDYAAGDYVVYPTHGVGRVTGIETQNISGFSLRLIAIKFEKDRMTLRVPVAKAQESGLRKLSTRKVMDSALAALKGKSRVKRTMWSRRAQEYEAKINSGDPVSIAEVVRDLHRGSDQPDQSYSERQMYQAALDRLAREFAAVEKIDEATAAERLEQLLKAA